MGDKLGDELLGLRFRLGDELLGLGLGDGMSKMDWESSLEACPNLK